MKLIRLFWLCLLICLGLLSALAAQEAAHLVHMPPYQQRPLSLDVDALEMLHPDSTRMVIMIIEIPNCKWCDRLHDSTLTDSVVRSYLEAYFDVIVFNAQQRATVAYRGTRYAYLQKANFGYHELAHQLTGGQHSYPTIVVFDEEMTPLLSTPGFKSAANLGAMLAYYGKGYHEQMPWMEFERLYQLKVALPDLRQR